MGRGGEGRVCKDDTPGSRTALGRLSSPAGSFLPGLAARILFARPGIPYK